MNWTEVTDQYCERIAPGLWAEPLNALTNLAFIVAGTMMWRRTKGVVSARILAGELVAIGIGSGLFHTAATRWAELADVLPILAFILTYVFLASRDFLGMRPLWAGVSALLFIPYAALTVPIFALIPGLGSSAGYGPVPVLILFYAWMLARRAPRTSRGLVGGAGLLLISIGFRALDDPLCGVWPFGTHFIWHLLNAAMLAGMIATYHWHMRAARLAGNAVGR